MLTPDQPLPRARRAQLIVKELPNETLVYDEESHEAHCLNQTAAFVWRHCDGHTSIAKMGRLLEKQAKTKVPEQLVWSALEQLEKSHLLEGPAPRPMLTEGMSRRELIRRLGIGTALALPVVVSIVAPTAAEAASTTCAPVGGPCSVDADCCSPARCGDGECFNP
ncbi:MAG TPA: PqqD family protein [Pyrinomonadaceae bacterium]|nr:PqqD family protein [Pyrinomonadaceae bacterium]